MSDVEQCADVRMIERRDRARLAFEAVAQLRVGGQGRRQDLDGHAAIKPRVARPVDFAHAPCAERAQDFVRTEPGAGCEAHSFNIAGQFTTSVMRFGEVSSDGLFIKKR